MVKEKFDIAFINVILMVKDVFYHSGVRLKDSKADCSA